MAIIKRGERYQVRVRGSDLFWITKTFGFKGEAKAYEAYLIQQKQAGTSVTNIANQITLDAYFATWMEKVAEQASPGWRKNQRQFYGKYVQPVLGNKKLRAISPDMILDVLGRMGRLERSEQSKVHVFNLMRKLFRDAIEVFQILTFNPVIRSLKPKIPQREAKHLKLDQIKSLLSYSRDKEYGIAIWLQIFLGLRVSEVIALQWADVDLEEGILTVRRSYSRQDTWATGEKVINDYPKGKKHHSHRIPNELWDLLKKTRKRSRAELVAVTSFKNGMLSYEFYLETLKRYCRELGILEISTHALRHSTSVLYRHFGASKDDLRILYAHADSGTTDRYDHYKGSNLEKVADVIELFPQCSQSVPNVPKVESNKK